MPCLYLVGPAFQVAKQGRKSKTDAVGKTAQESAKFEEISEDSWESEKAERKTLNLSTSTLVCEEFA